MNEEQIRKMCNDIYEGGEWQPMIDYITNLQQENEELKKKLDRRYYKNEYERIKEENEELKEANKVLEENWEHYMLKCEKAIEYIKENLTLISILDGKKFYGLNDYKFSYQDLLNILQNGSEKDDR